MVEAARRVRLAPVIACRHRERGGGHAKHWSYYWKTIVPSVVVRVRDLANSRGVALLAGRHRVITGVVPEGLGEDGGREEAQRNGRRKKR